MSDQPDAGAGSPAPAQPDPSDPVALLSALIRCPSVTPADAGALAVVEAALTSIGFACERITFTEEGTDDIDNLFATIGESGPHLAYNGHTDVVPPGDARDWTHDPFAGALVDGIVHGRGAVDMKGGIAAFIAAVADFVREARSSGGLPGRLTLMITGDEESVSVNGTVKLVRWAAERGHRFDACIVGEPTSVERLGDTIKVGRRGSLSGDVTVAGTQGHVAYPHKADNPLPRLLKLAGALLEPLDRGTDVFQASNLEITSIDTGNPARNVIPSRASFKFNIRFNDLWTGETLRREVTRRLESADPDGRFEVTYVLSGEAFHTADEKLVEAVSEGVQSVTGERPQATTGGGTSDARFMKDYCPVVELGLVGTTMHQVDERVPAAELLALKDVYIAVLRRYFASDRAPS